MGIERLQEEIVTEEIENLRSLVRSVKKRSKYFFIRK